MKKTLTSLLLLIILSISAIKSSAQCVDTIGTNKPYRDAKNIVLAVWGGNIASNAYVWIQIRYENSDVKNRYGYWIVSQVYNMTSSCNGWMMNYHIPVSSIQKNQKIQYQAVMITNNGTRFETEIETINSPGRPFRPDSSTIAQISVINTELQMEHVETINEFFKPEQNTPIEPNISRIGRDFTVTTNDFQEYNLYVFDLTGKIVSEFGVVSENFNFSLPSVPTGVYIFILENGKDKVTKRIFLE